MSTPKSWFDLLFDEFKARGEAMFAFSQKQVEEAFEGEHAVTWEQVQTEWYSYGAGLLIKRSALKEFINRMDADFKAWESRQPEVRVKYLGTDYWDMPAYKVVSHDKGAPVRVGQTLVDVALLKPGEAVSLHSITSEGEPISDLNIHVVHVTEEVAQ